MFSSRTILRYNSLSSLPSLCRTRPPLAWRALLSTTATASPTTLQDLATRFRERIWHCSALSLAPTYDIHFTYRSLRRALRAPDSSHSPDDTRSLLTRSDLYNALDVLATSAKGDDFLLIKDLLEDMPTYFGQAVTIDTHRMVIRALVDSDNTRALLRWLTTMRTESGGVQPTLEFWHMFMDHCLLHSDIRTMSQGIRTMQSQGLPANNATYKFLARKMFMASSHHFLWAIRIINRISRTKLPFDDALLAIMLEGFNGLGLPSQAARVEAVYRSRYLDDQQVSRVQSGLDFNARLAQAYLRDGQVVAVDLYRSFRERGFQPSQATLIALLDDTRKAEDIAFWERTLGIKAGSRVWSKVIRNVSLSHPPAVTLEIYRAAKAGGVPTDLNLAEPVIRSICSSSLRSPTDTALDMAVGIYKEIEEEPASEPKFPNMGQRVLLFQTLLRALSTSANKTKYMPIATDLLEDMKQRGLSDSSHITSLVILLMRAAADFSEAFNAYKTVRERTQVAFEAKGYAAILHTFATLRFGNRTIPPWEAYFQIITDMQEDGAPILPHIYTSMFRQMARLAARARRSDPDHLATLQKIVATARKLQHQLSISPAVTLDVPFWNQLMDTYQRAGAFDDAWRIWDKLFHEGRADAASVSIVFDACGRAGAGRTAVQIFAALRAAGFRFNLRNWHAWLECLCRLGQLDEAARYFCIEMGSGPHGVAPDEEGARILLKFANHRGVGDEVRMRIQRFLPALWKKLPPDIVQGTF